MSGIDPNYVAMKAIPAYDTLVEQLKKMEQEIFAIQEVLDFEHSTSEMQKISLSDRMQRRSAMLARLSSGELVSHFVTCCTLATAYITCHEIIQEDTDRYNKEAEKERQLKRDFQEFLKSRK